MNIYQEFSWGRERLVRSLKQKIHPQTVSPRKRNDISYNIHFIKNRGAASVGFSHRSLLLFYPFFPYSAITLNKNFPINFRSCHE